MEILQNPQVQQAITTLLVLALTALIDLIRRKTATSAIVNEWWSYIKPAVEAALKTIEAARQTGEPIDRRKVAEKAIAVALERFALDYALHERRDPSERIMGAVEREVASAIGEAL